MNWKTTSVLLLRLFRGAQFYTIGFKCTRPRLSPKRFSSDDDHDDDEMVTTFNTNEVLLWMRQQPREFYAAEIGALIKRWDKCINIGGGYVEK
ncbi:hypothetical protein AVEN_210758-1 [Araneus ventricosus]|uniref:Uncharacterized protein n=1 Tax=Araneus ventricosus TaxID=182803 RepID=A0A4Y2WK86_ARAVE|nr:hypothetical protein AVEN_210758-1 [Araneus ventricosus]